MKKFLKFTGLAILATILLSISYGMYKAYIGSYFESNLFMGILGIIGSVCVMVSIFTLMGRLWKTE